jgi:Cdc6-like AAA superfamily ATPase
MKIDLNAIGAIFIEGPRGCGKTSTGEFFSKTVFKLDKNNEIRLKAENTPEILFANDKPILIDE